MDMEILWKISLGAVRVIYIIVTVLPFFFFMCLYVLGGGDMVAAFSKWFFWLKKG